MRASEPIRRKARELAARLDAEGRAYVPLGHEIDPVARAGAVVGASAVVERVARRDGSVRFSLATGGELGKPEVWLAYVVWLEGAHR